MKRKMLIVLALCTSLFSTTIANNNDSLVRDSIKVLNSKIAVLYMTIVRLRVDTAVLQTDIASLKNDTVSLRAYIKMLKYDTVPVVHKKMPAIIVNPIDTTTKHNCIATPKAKLNKEWFIDTTTHRECIITRTMPNLSPDIASVKEKEFLKELQKEAEDERRKKEIEHNIIIFGNLGAALLIISLYWYIVIRARKRKSKEENEK